MKFVLYILQILNIAIAFSTIIIGLRSIKYLKENKILSIGTSTHNVHDVGISQGSFDYLTKTYTRPVNIRQTFKETGCEKNWVYFNHRNKELI